MIKGLLGRLGLAARIGAAIAAAVIAIQVLVTLVFLTHPPNSHPFYSARWLSGSAVEIIKKTRAAVVVNDYGPTGMRNGATAAPAAGSARPGCGVGPRSPPG